VLHLQAAHGSKDTMRQVLPGMIHARAAIVAAFVYDNPLFTLIPKPCTCDLDVSIKPAHSPCAIPPLHVPVRLSTPCVDGA
jgi:hypothetical protein